MNNEEGYLLVVGTAFIRNGKVLVSMSKRSAKKGKYTLVGGGVETYDGSFRRAAKRECEEEIANGFVIDEKQLVPIIVFREPALSDPSINIEMHMYLSLKDIDVDIESNDEIVEYRWFTLGEDDSILSTAVRNYFIPWAKKNNIMY